MRLENNQIAITDKIAKQIFGTESPIGKQLIFPNTNNTKMTIVAVVKHGKVILYILLIYYYIMRIKIHIGGVNEAIHFSVFTLIVI